MEKEVFTLNSISIQPNPVEVKKSIYISVDMSYEYPYLDYPFDYSYDYKEEK